MGLNTKQIGTITEYECAIYLMKLGCTISFPLGDYAPYDFIADYHDHLLRIQVKKSTYLDNGAFQIECTTSQFRGDGVHTRIYTSNEIDYFATMFEDTCYLIDQKECKTSKILRIEVPKNLQLHNIFWAVNYEAEFKLAQLLDSNATPRVDMQKILSDLKFKKQKESLLSIDTNNSQYGTMWITNDQENKKIYKGEEIPVGFHAGRVV